MSLAGAIEALRKTMPLVPSVPSSENMREPPEAAPAVAVPSVPLVPSEKTKSQRETAASEGRENSGQMKKSQNGEVLNSSISGNQGNQVNPLTDQELVELINKEAHRAGLLPADLWRFLAEDDIGAIRTGELGEIAALRAFAASRGHTMDKTEGGHALPFPGTRDFITPGENQS